MMTITPGLPLFNPHVFSAVEVPGQPGAIERIQSKCVDEIRGLKLLSRSPEPAERRMLEEQGLLL